MSDDFGTVSVRRGDRAREIEMVRQRYRNHREALAGLSADPPSEHLGGEYQRLLGEIDASLQKLDEMEHRPRSAGLPGTAPASAAPRRTSPGSQPLVNALQADDPSYAPIEEGSIANSGSTSRVLLIVIVGLVVLGLIGWLIWRASSDRKAPPAIIERSTATSALSQSTQPLDVAPAGEQESSAGLKVKPATADYGTIRRGTRAVRQFEVTNVSNTTLTLDVVRSSCRCLYYAYNAKIPPKGHETVTVTVDAAHAKEGALDEQVTVKTKENKSIGTTLGIHAIIK